MINDNTCSNFDIEDYTHIVHFDLEGGNKDA